MSKLFFRFFSFVLSFAPVSITAMWVSALLGLLFPPFKRWAEKKKNKRRLN